MLTFLSPWWVMATAAGLTVPTLVLFYFLKLRRQEMVVPSTFLWKRAVRDLQVNAPFQRLRNNLLLILQLLILLAAILALGGPMMPVERERDKRMVLLIDHSASMNTREADGTTRLALAKEQAKALVENLGAADQAMLIVFSDEVSLVTPFTGDKASLARQIDGIEPTDRPTRLKEALQLAEHHSTPQVVEDAGGSMPPEFAAPQAQIILFSDGRIAGADSLVLRRGEMEMVRVGAQTDNVGVVALEVKRNYETPEKLNVFARVRNFSDQAVNVDLELLIDGQTISVQTVPELEPGMSATGGADGALLPGSAPASVAAPPPGSVGLVPFPEIDFAETGVAEVRLSRADALAADDRAFAIIPPPRQMTVLLVTKGHMFLPKLLAGMPLRTFDQMTPDEYEALDDAALRDDGRPKYDVVIFDDHQTQKLPLGAYIFFGGGPDIEGVTVGEEIDNEIIVTWDETHPILRYVTFDDVMIHYWSRLTLPDEAVTLVEGESSPVIAYFGRDGRQYLLIAFSFFNQARDSLTTTWWRRRSLVIFMYNALRYLSGSLSVSDSRAVHPGEAVALVAPPGAKTITVTAPDNSTHDVPVSAGRVTYFGGTDRVGLYRVAPAVAGQEHFAVNLLDENESFIAPNEDLRIGVQIVETREGSQLINQPLWPYLLLAALAVILFEWYVYNKRVLI